MSIVQDAVAFSTEMHAGQTRKYTGEPYIVHPMRVALTVAATRADNKTVAAAVLHDVVEDTEATESDILKLFGPTVCRLVMSVTDVSVPADGNRAARKAIDRAHLAKACAGGKTIKLADLIDNTESIVAHDPDFAAVYLDEKRALLPHLLGGSSSLWFQAAFQAGFVMRGVAHA